RRSQVRQQAFAHRGELRHVARQGGAQGLCLYPGAGTGLQAGPDALGPLAEEFGDRSPQVADQERPEDDEVEGGPEEVADARGRGAVLHQTARPRMTRATSWAMSRAGWPRPARATVISSAMRARTSFRVRWAPSRASASSRFCSCSAARTISCISCRA